MTPESPAHRLPVRSLVGRFSHSLYDLPRPGKGVAVTTPKQTESSTRMDARKAASELVKTALNLKRVKDTAIGAWNWMKPVASPAGKSLLGGAGGGLASNEEGMGFTPGAIAGMAAFSPLGRRTALGRTLSQPIRSGIFGSSAGGGVDLAAGAAGVDTGGAGARWGGRVGFGLGGARAVAPLLPGTAARNVTWANKRVAGGMTNFDKGLFDPVLGSVKALASAPWRAAGRAVPSLLQRGTAPVSLAQGVGRLVGAGGLAAAGLGAAYHGLAGRVGDWADNKAVEYAAAAGQLAPEYGRRFGEAATAQAVQAAPGALAALPGEMARRAGNRLTQFLTPSPRSVSGTDLTALSRLGEWLNAARQTGQPAAPARNELDYQQTLLGGSS